MKTLERRLNLMSVIAISVGAMLGSGLFVLPGLAFAHTGPSVWLAYLVAGLCVLPAALSMAELSTAMPVSGGTYVHIDRTFGPLISTVVGLALWMALLLKSAFALVGFGAYLVVLTAVSVKPIGIALLVGIVALNILGVRKVGQVQKWIVGAALAGLLGLSAWGAIEFNVELLRAEFQGGSGGFLFATSLVYISFAGVAKVAAIAEEVRDPGRNLPLGILLSLGFVTLLYAGITFIMAGTVHPQYLHGDIHPIYTMARALGGPAIGVGAALLAIGTMTSMANVGLLAASRFPFAMSRDNLLPAFLERVNQRFMTPVGAIVLTGLVMAAAIIFLDIEGLAKLASALLIACFTMVNLAVVVLRESSVQWYKPAYRAPLYPVVQILGLLIGVVLLLMLGTTSAIALIGIVVPGAAVFMFLGRRTERRGVLGRLGPRKELLASPARAQQDQLPSEAGVVIPLFGSEPSAEALAEIATALAGTKKVEVVHMTDIPEQIMLDAMLEDDLKVSSLRRRINALAKEWRHDIEFDAMVSRDVVRTVHDISRRLSCDWLVIDWGRRSQGGLLLFNPLGWLISHLPCNLALFRDAGIRSFREILVLAEPGPHDALVARTADHLAEVYDASITFVRFVPDGSSEAKMQSEVEYLEQLCELCDSQALERIVQGQDEVKVIAQISSGYDLLIIGSSPGSRIQDYVRGTPADRLTRLAACSVLRLTTPRERTHEAITYKKTPGEKPALQIRDYLLPECMGARLDVANKDVLFEHLARSFAGAVESVTPEAIEAALWERERAQNTAVGRGVALPHATITDIDRTYLGVFTTAAPVDYKAADGQPANVFFVTIGPPGDRNTHLHILAEVSRLLLKTSLLGKLRAAQDPQEFLDAFDGSRQDMLLEQPV